MQEQRTVSHEALRRAADRIGASADGAMSDRYLDRLLAEVEAEAAARRKQVEAEVRSRWQERSEELEQDVSGYAVSNYLYWIEDANRDEDDEDEAAERRRAKYGTLGEWAKAEHSDSYVEGAGLHPAYENVIAEHAEEVARDRLVREGDPDDIERALDESISKREWGWPRVATASIQRA
jgi:hypothetical protein